MQNIEAYGVQQLNSQEINDIDGGIIPLIVIAALLIPLAAY